MNTLIFCCVDRGERVARGERAVLGVGCVARIARGPTGGGAVAGGGVGILIPEVETHTAVETPCTGEQADARAIFVALMQAAHAPETGTPPALLPPNANGGPPA